MNIIEFIFMILKHYVPVTPSQLVALEKEAEEWYYGIKEKDDQVSKFVAKWGEMWYFRTGLAVLYIFAVRWVAEYMSPRDKDYDDYED